MARAWIEDLWLTEPKVTLPDGTATRIPVPSAAVKSLAAYMKTPDKALLPRFLAPSGPIPHHDTLQRFPLP